MQKEKSDMLRWLLEAIFIGWLFAMGGFLVMAEEIRKKVPEWTPGFITSMLLGLGLGFIFLAWVYTFALLAGAGIIR